MQVSDKQANVPPGDERPVKIGHWLSFRNKFLSKPSNLLFLS